MNYATALHTAAAQPGTAAPSLTAFVVILAVAALVLGGKVTFGAGPFQVTLFRPRPRKRRSRR